MPTENSEKVVGFDALSRGATQWRIVLALSILAVIAWIGWRTFLAPGEGQQEVVQTPPPSMVEPASEDPGEVFLEPLAEDPAPPPVPSGETRAAVPDVGVAVLGGTVSSALDGRPISGATVTWTTWSNRFLMPALASVEIPVTELANRTLSAETDESGAYRFEQPPPDAENQISVLWVTHPTYAARSQELEPGTAGELETVDFELSEVDPIHVRVLNGGQQAGQAEVFQVISFPRGTIAPYDDGEHLPKDLLMFARRYTWNPGRVLSVAPLGQAEPQAQWPKEHRLWAECDQGLSPSYRGSDQPDIRLTLQPAFFVKGVILPPDPDGVQLAQWTDGQWGQARVQISAWQGPVQKELGSLVPDEDGVFGPQPLPWVRADRYQATLVGNRFVPNGIDFAAPQPGEEVDLRLLAEIGNVIWIVAIDTQEIPIPFPWARVQWTKDDQLQSHLFRGRPDGYIVLQGVPNGLLDGMITAQGFSSEFLAPLLSPAAKYSAPAYHLSPVQALFGRCMLGSEPARDFEVRYWKNQDVRARGSIQIHDSDDGMFEIKNPLPGELVLTAITDGFSISPEVILPASGPEREEEILLVALDPGLLTGRIVDAETNAPLPNGSVTLYTTHSFKELDPIGPAIQAAGDGSIRMLRLPKGMSIVSFSAPSHSTRELKVWYDGHQPVRLGNIELDPTQPLRASLLLPDGQDPTRFLLVAEGIGAIPPTHFDARGELVVPEASGGVFLFGVYEAEKVGYDDPLVNRHAWLRAGEIWDLRFDLSGGGSLTAVVSPREQVQEVLRVTATFQDSKGMTTWRTVPFDKSGRAELHAIPPGSVVLRVTSGPDDTVRATEEVEFPTGPSQHLTVEIDLDAHPARVRVVDPSGAPQQEVFVQISARGIQGPDLAVGITDRNGRCDFPPLPPTADTISLFGPEAGVNEHLPFQLPTRPDEVVEIVFDLSASLRLHLSDEGIPQPTATVRLWSPERPDRILTPGRLPDADGNLTLPRLGPGTYELRASAANLWPASMVVEATPEGPLYEVSVRRLGAMEPTFIDSTGSVLAGEAMLLEYVPTGESVADWIAAGKLKVSPDALRTDASGRLHLNRIPHGTYRWRFGESEGVIDVPVEGSFKGVVEVP